MDITTPVNHNYLNVLKIPLKSNFMVLIEVLYCMNLQMSKQLLLLKKQVPIKKYNLICSEYILQYIVICAY